MPQQSGNFAQLTPFMSPRGIEKFTLKPQLQCNKAIN